MENDAKMNRAEDALGADNADILAAKRKRAAAEQQAKEKPAGAHAEALHVSMEGAHTPSVPRASAVQNMAPANVRKTPSGGVPRATRPATQIPPTAASRTNAAQPQRAPAAAPKPVLTQKPAAVQKPITEEKTVALPKTTAPKQTVTPKKTTASPAVPNNGGQTASPRATGASMPTGQIPAVHAKVHSLIPHQKGDLSAEKKSSETEHTRITNLQAIKVDTASMEQTRLSRVQPVVPPNGNGKKRRDDEDESEGGNAILSVIKAITYIVSVIVVSVFLATFIVLVGNDIYAFVKDESVVQLTVPENATVDDVAVLLHENGVIEYPTVFKLYAKYKAKDNGVFLAGEYTDITPMMNYDELLAAFKPKKPSGTSRITIPEGYTTDEIIELFLSYGIGTREGFVDVINNYDFDYWFIDALEENGVKEGRYYRLDGYLFPDTYEFYNASSEEVVIGKLLRRFNEVFVAAYRQKAQELGYTVDEILTLASMIEKEGGTQADFFDISSVFNNRLKNPAVYPYLESDATIVYAIRHETGEHITPTGEDISYESPYNTYLNRGLPPGPIANPSASAIRAALYPSDTKYYFFVSASPTVTYYASTKAEHDANIQKIRDATAQSGQ